MLSTLYNIHDTSINSIIEYNRDLGRKIYVIDVFRLPIELKISAFFEKIQKIHFNKLTLEQLTKLPIQIIMDMFHKLFPHIGIGDNYMDKYNITLPLVFDHENKYEILEQNNITYIKLLLCKSHQWGELLTTVFGTKINIIKDYETRSKQIGILYAKFKRHYQLPQNLISNIKNCKHLNYFFTQNEITQYINVHRIAQSHITPYTQYEYSQYLLFKIPKHDIIRFDHYFDNDCKCKQCNKKRLKIKQTGIGEKIIHETQQHDQHIIIPSRGTNMFIPSSNPHDFRFRIFLG